MIDKIKILKLLRMNLVIHIFILFISIFILNMFVQDLQVLDVCNYYYKIQNSFKTDSSFIIPDYHTDLNGKYLLLIGLLLIFVLEESFRLMKVYRLIREVEI